MVAFASTFLSYLLLMLLIVVIAGIAVVIGITMRKKKNAKDAETVVEQVEDNE